MSLFPEDDKARKGMPIFKLVTRYFPKALREITKVSVANNVRYNPGRDPFDINWARDKSKDQMGSLFRHMLERTVDGKKFESVPSEFAEKIGYNRVYVLAEAAWRALAALELEIEEVEAEQGIPQFVATSSATTVTPGAAVSLEPFGAHADFVQPHSGWMGKPRGPSFACDCGDKIVFDTCGWRDPVGILHTRRGCSRG